jgi:hypothetical protein
MRGYQVQRLQIFTILCMSEEFCCDLTCIEGVINLLVAALLAKSLVPSAVRLIGAMASHGTGCQILSEHGVLEMFTQLFLSSSTGDDIAVTHRILRNFAKHGCEIPQGSLIVSCLMQDMLYDIPRHAEIMDTLVALVQSMQCSVQEHDLQRIVMQQLSSDQPLLIRLSLKLFARCDAALLRNLYPRLLGAIHKLLCNQNYLYPEIIEGCFEVMLIIAQQFDVSEFIRQTQILRFVTDVIELLPPNDNFAAVFQKSHLQLQQAVSAYFP